jgi:hypothetical protein
MRHFCDSFFSSVAYQFHHLRERLQIFVNESMVWGILFYFFFSIDRENLVFSYKGKKKKIQDGSDTIKA